MSSPTKRFLTPHPLLILILAIILLSAPTQCQHLPITIRPPRPSSTHPASPHPRSTHGFPTTVRIFSTAPEQPLTVLETLRYHTFPRDALWRTARLAPAPPKTHYNAVDLLGGITRVGEYYTMIRIGSQRVRVQIDTGSSTLALPTASCLSCPPSDLRYNPSLSPSPTAHTVLCTNALCAPDTCLAHACSHCSSTDACCADSLPSACGFSLKYGDGSYARGALIIDDLSWGANLTAPVVFGGILDDSPQFERPLVDGILGLAYAALACNPTCVEPPFQQMVKAGVVKDKFAICMTRRGGKLILGEVDPKMAKGKITYVPLALSDVPTYYTVNVSSTISVGDGAIPLPNFRHGVIDSGTTLIVFTEVTFVLILQFMQEHYCHIPHMCGAQTFFRPSACVKISDDVLAKLPTFTFRLGDDKKGGTFDLVLRPQDYMVETKLAGQSLRCLGFMALPKLTKGTDIIFGNTFMLRYLTIYDRENKRMGFAESSSTCGEPPACSSYTQCIECAMEEECVFNFKTRKCSAAADSKASFMSFPVCQGSSCRCGFEQSFLAVGVATGFFSSLGLVGLITLMGSWCCGWNRRKPTPQFGGADEDEWDSMVAEPLPLVANAE